MRCTIAIPSMTGHLARISLATCSILAWPAVAAEYFPLAVGNQWVYRLDGAPERVVTTIGQTREVDGQTYFVYAGLDGPSVLLRRNAQGQLLVRQPDRAEGVWADFAADRWETALAPCPGAAAVEEVAILMVDMVEVAVAGVKDFLAA